MFEEFDLDHSGHIEANELFALGQARRHAGHKQGEWTHEKTNAMIKHMGGEDGRVQKDGFVEYFQELSLSLSPSNPLHTPLFTDSPTVAPVPAYPPSSLPPDSLNQSSMCLNRSCVSAFHAPQPSMPINPLSV